MGGFGGIYCYLGVPMGHPWCQLGDVGFLVTDGAGGKNGSFWISGQGLLKLLMMNNALKKINCFRGLMGIPQGWDGDGTPVG